MNFEDRIAERVREVVGQWPMTDAVYACVNCNVLFKDGRETNMKCPVCDSSSIFRATVVLNREAEQPSDAALSISDAALEGGKVTREPGNA